MTPRPPHDWIQIFVTALPGLAAVGALIFTWLSINATTSATNKQLGIAEQGQVTDRYNAAITNLGSSSVDVRLGGIYALQRIMQDSPRDQPTVVAVLCAFIRDHANAATANSANSSASQRTSSDPGYAPIDTKAALTVVVTRNAAHDSSATVVDLTDANLSGVALNGADLVRTVLIRANLSDANLSHADLTGADLTGADLRRANLTGADFTDAFLYKTDLTGASLTGAKGLTSTP